MNNKKALEELKELLFGSGFVIHERCLREFRDLLKQELRGKENQFFNILTTQLKNIHDFGVLVDKVDDNERLKGGSGKYHSIHLKQNQFNVRLLIHVKEDGTAYLLCIFYERSGKGRTEYGEYLKVLDERLADLMEV